MKMKDMQRVKNQKLNDLEEEEQENREYLQKRANQMRQEQEDEIKYLNEVCSKKRKLNFKEETTEHFV